MKAGTITAAADLAAQGAWAQALLDAGNPPPPGLRAWNGADPASRFAVHRNNAVASLVAALGESFPVLREWVGAEFFDAMAREHVRAQPPRSPVLALYGAGFADWLQGFAPAAVLPYLGDLARLEFARLRACHAADAGPLAPAQLAQRLQRPDRLPAWRPSLHPSLTLLRSRHGVVSLWAAHQGRGRLEDVALDRPEQALVLRAPDDQVLVLPLAAADAALVAGLLAGATLGAAVAAAQQPPAAPAGFDAAGVLALLIRHGALVAGPDEGDDACRAGSA